jgi:hypothetical protein
MEAAADGNLVRPVDERESVEVMAAGEVNLVRPVDERARVDVRVGLADVRRVEDSPIVPKTEDAVLRATALAYRDERKCSSSRWNSHSNTRAVRVFVFFDNVVELRVQSDFSHSAT